MTVFLLTLALVGLAMLIMGVGVLFGNRCLRGSCGGPEATGPDGESLTCAACPNRKEQDTESAAAGMRSA
ncbi:MAG: hypothetical protein ACE5JI_17240 [Acidobacteriota bacterium]